MTVIPPELAAFEAAQNAHRPYFLLGLGPRRKLIWRDNTLLDAITGEVIRQWPEAYNVRITPDRNRVRFDLPQQAFDADYWPMEIEDSEGGTWIGNRHTLYCRNGDVAFISTSG